METEIIVRLDTIIKLLQTIGILQLLYILVKLAMGILKGFFKTIYNDIINING